MTDKKKVRCGRCRSHIAYYENGETIVRYPFFSVYTIGGMTTIECKGRGCGAPNFVVDEAWKKANPEQYLKQLNVKNMTEAVFDTFLPREEYMKSKGAHNV